MTLIVALMVIILFVSLGFALIEYQIKNEDNNDDEINHYDSNAIEALNVAYVTRN